MTEDTEYQSYLQRAASALATAGGSLVLPHPGGQSGPAWSAGWDQVILVESPGAPAVYAFTQLDTPNVDEARSRFDRLAAGISSAGIQSQAPVRLIGITVVPGPAPERELRHLASLAPSVYYAGLRPSMWAVDLSTRRAETGRRLGSPEGADLVRRALDPASHRPGLVEGEAGELRRTYAAQTSAFYALMRGRPPLATYSLIAVNVLLFLLLYANGGPENETTLRDFGAMSARLVEQGQVWRLFTSMFLHASIPHILFNMTSLFAVGTLAERLYGSARFVAIYLGAGLIGSLVSFGYAVATGSLDVLGVGASGAIFGVAGALVTVRYQHSDVIPQSVRNRVSTSILPLVILSLVFSFLTPYVDNSAHIGGLLSGAALSFLFPLTRTVPELQQ